MKKILLASALCSMALGFTACSDNDDVANPTTPSTVPTSTLSGIDTEVKSAVIEVPINCSGEWIADVDSCDWLEIIDEDSPLHKGNGVIKLKIDENRTGVGRKNKLTIVDFNDNQLEIPVYQSNLYNGEVPSNGASDWFNSNHIGCCANYTYFMVPDSTRSSVFEPLKVALNDNIFNMANIEHTQKATSQTGDPLYVMSRIKSAYLGEKDLVNSISKSDSLAVTIEMDCSFGFIEFHGKGQYTSSMENNSDKVNYFICRQSPVLDANLQVQNITATIHEKMDESMNDKFTHDLDSLVKDAKKLPENSIARKLALNKVSRKRPNFGGLFSKGFSDAYWNVFSFYLAKDTLYPGDKAKQEIEMTKRLDALNSIYGPFFISGGHFGGSLNLYATVDKKELNEDAQFRAEIQAQISSLFSLEGHVDFTSDGQQVYKKSDIFMQVYGGNAAETANNVVKLLDGPNMTRTDSLTMILNEWIASFGNFDEKTNEPTGAAPISFNLTPIWTLFSYDVELQNIVENYFKQKYADKGIDTWSRILEGDATQTEELLRKLAGVKSGSKSQSQKAKRSITTRRM